MHWLTSELISFTASRGWIVSGGRISASVMCQWRSTWNRKQWHTKSVTDESHWQSVRLTEKFAAKPKGDHWQSLVNIAKINYIDNRRKLSEIRHRWQRIPVVDDNQRRSACRATWGVVVYRLRGPPARICMCRSQGVLCGPTVRALPALAGQYALQDTCNFVDNDRRGCCSYICPGCCWAFWWHRTRLLPRGLWEVGWL